MNPMPTNETDIETPQEEGVGHRLRAVREARKLCRNEVAAVLHLSESIIEALEQDDRERLPGPVFVQGYLRKYARLLDVPEEPILQAYGHHPAHRSKRKTGLAGSPLKPEIRSNHAIVRLVTWLIVVVLVALVVTWWRGYLQWPPVERAGETAPVDDSVDPGVSAISESQEPGAISALPRELLLEQDFRAPMEEEPEPELETSAPVDEVEIRVARTEEMQVEFTDNELPMDAEAPSVEAEPPEGLPETEAVSMVEVLPVASGAASAAEMIDYENSIVIEFSSPCWTDIRDATGTYKLLGNMGMGEKRVLGGEPPYSVILGNSRAVTLTIKGQPYDLSPHSKGNVTRFTLQPEEIPDT